nr:MAG TPA: hypothetical protein [Caudoviricetes sp.]
MRNSIIFFIIVCCLKVYRYICNIKALKEWHSGILVLTAAFGALFVYICFYCLYLQ